MKSVAICYSGNKIPAQQPLMEQNRQGDKIVERIQCTFRRWDGWRKGNWLAGRGSGYLSACRRDITKKEVSLPFRNPEQFRELEAMPLSLSKNQWISSVEDFKNGPLPQIILEALIWDIKVRLWAEYIWGIIVLEQSANDQCYIFLHNYILRILYRTNRSILRPAFPMFITFSSSSILLVLSIKYLERTQRKYWHFPRLCKVNKLSFLQSCPNSYFFLTALLLGECC